MKRKRVLVTGGAGYIGSHTVVELISQNYEVVIADNLSNSSKQILDGIRQITGKTVPFEQVDVSVKNDLEYLFEKYEHFDGVIHFAAYKAVGESVQKPLDYYRNNLDSLILLLERMGRSGSCGMIFSSSCTVYGQPDQLPVTEATPFKPAESPYGRTKQMGENILEDACRANKNLKAIALRYFNPVGAHASGLIGELPNGVPSNLVPFITQTAAGIREELKVFGDDYNTPDGSALRDYIHVVDLAKAHVAALARLFGRVQKKNFECFNVGTGRSVSVLELIRAFEQENGVQLSYRIVGRREGDIEQIYADTSLAQTELGWKAQLDVRDMMRSAWQWQLNCAEMATV